MKGKKSLITGMIALILLLFTFALFSIVSLTMWNSFDGIIQNTSNTTVNQLAKDRVHSLNFIERWIDIIFMILFTIMIVAFLISCVTIPVNEPAYFLIVIFLLVIIGAISMFLTNSWVYLKNFSLLADAAESMKLTDFVMTYNPYIVIVIGLIGTALFYGRKSTGIGTGFNNFGGGVDNLE